MFFSLIFTHIFNKKTEINMFKTYSLFIFFIFLISRVFYFLQNSKMLPSQNSVLWKIIPSINFKPIKVFRLYLIAFIIYFVIMLHMHQKVKRFGTSKVSLLSQLYLKLIFPGCLYSEIWTLELPPLTTNYYEQNFWSLSWMSLTGFIYLIFHR